MDHYFSGRKPVMEASFEGNYLYLLLVPVFAVMLLVDFFSLVFHAIVIKVLYEMGCHGKIVFQHPTAKIYLFH